MILFFICLFFSKEGIYRNGTKKGKLKIRWRVIAGFNTMDEEIKDVPAFRASQEEDLTFNMK